MWWVCRLVQPKLQNRWSSALQQQYWRTVRLRNMSGAYLCLGENLKEISNRVCVLHQKPHGSNQQSKFLLPSNCTYLMHLNALHMFRSLASGTVLTGDVRLDSQSAFQHVRSQQLVTQHGEVWLSKIKFTSAETAWLSWSRSAGRVVRAREWITTCRRAAISSSEKL